MCVNLLIYGIFHHVEDVSVALFDRNQQHIQVSSDSASITHMRAQERALQLLLLLLINARHI